VNTVAHSGKRRFGDIEKIQTVASMAAGKAFNDVRANGVGRSTHLLSKFESFVRRKCLQRKLMESDEEIVRSLPRDERMMM
jgi:hypothetical protein